MMWTEDTSRRRPTIVDASVLLNFLGLCRLDLLTALARRIVITPEVNLEIKRYRMGLDVALTSEEVRAVSPTLDEEDSRHFARLTRRLSVADASCIVAAKVLGADIASDDRAVCRAAAELLPLEAIVGTETMLSEAVRAGLLTLVAGDELLGELIHIRYRPKVASLRELLG